MIAPLPSAALRLVAIVVAAGALAWMLGLGELIHGALESHRRLEGLAQRVARTRSDADEARQLRARLEQASLSGFASAHGDRSAQDPQIALSLLSGSLLEAGLRVEHLKPASIDHRADHAVLPVILSVVGSYSQLRILVAELQRSAHAPVWQQIHLQAVQPQAGELRLAATLHLHLGLGPGLGPGILNADRSGPHPKSQALTDPQADPFDLSRLVSPSDRASREPGRSRKAAQLRLPVLNGHPLEALSMVGSLERGGERMALMRTPGGVLEAGQGMDIGLRGGRISRISETEVEVLEPHSGKARPGSMRRIIISLKEDRL